MDAYDQTEPHALDTVAKDVSSVAKDVSSVLEKLDDFSVQLKELSKSVASTAESQRTIERLQRELRDLQTEQISLSEGIRTSVDSIVDEQNETHRTLELQKIELAIIKKNAEVAARNSAILLEESRLDELRRAEKKRMSESVFALKSLLDFWPYSGDHLVNYVILKGVKDAVDKNKLLPERFEELADKEYTKSFLMHLDECIEQTTKAMDSADRDDISTWELAAREELRIKDVYQTIEVLRQKIGSLHSEILWEHNNRQKKTVLNILFFVSLILTPVTGGFSILFAGFFGIWRMMLLGFGPSEDSLRGNLAALESKLQDSQRQIPKLEQDSDSIHRKRNDVISRHPDLQIVSQRLKSF